MDAQVEYDPDTYLTWNTQRTQASLVMSEPAPETFYDVYLPHQLVNSIRSLMPHTTLSPGNYDFPGDLRCLMSRLENPSFMRTLISQNLPPKYWDPALASDVDGPTCATLRVRFDGLKHTLSINPVHTVIIPIPRQDIINTIAETTENVRNCALRKEFTCDKLSALPVDVQTYLAEQAELNAS